MEIFWCLAKIRQSHLPASIIFISTMPLRYVKVSIDWREFHMILIFERIRCISRISWKIDSISLAAWCNGNLLVICIPRIVLQVLNNDTEFRAVVFCQLMQQFISNPKFSIGITKTIGIFVPCTIKVHWAVLTPLDNRPRTDAFSHYWSSLMWWRNHVQTIFWWRIYLRAVIWESFQNIFILRFDTFELFEEFRCWMLTSFCIVFIFSIIIIVLNFLKEKERKKKNEEI